MRVVLAIGGSDSSGCAGIAADIRAISSTGAHAAIALTCVTAQTRAGVTDLAPLPASLVRSQIESAFEDLPIVAVKSGALGSPEAAEVIARALLDHDQPPYVLDPVLVTTSGSSLASPEIVEAMRHWLFRFATLITPNAAEAEALTGLPVRTAADAARAGRALIDAGCHAVLVTGGHLDERGTDVLVTVAGVQRFPGKPIANPNTRGTGCTLASAIAAYIAAGWHLDQAIASARILIQGAIEDGYDLNGRGPVDALARMHGSAGTASLLAEALRD